MTMTFNVVDVETANNDRRSICSIGIIQVRDGNIANSWQTLINPETWFAPRNIKIHKITQRDVKHSPTLPMVHSELCSLLSGSILVSHTSFDRIAFELAMDHYNLEQFQVTWLDSTMIVRRAWPEKYRSKDYNLKNVAKDLGISFKHHNALEDARAAAEIVLRVCEATGKSIEDWLHLSKEPISQSPSLVRQPIKREGNVDGALYGKTVVFTGKCRISRKELADIAAKAGCRVVDNITKEVNMLVVGIQDMRQLKGYDKSSNHRKVEELKEKGIEIEILSEDDFFKLIDVDRLG